MKFENTPLLTCVQVWERLSQTNRLIRLSKRGKAWFKISKSSAVSRPWNRNFIFDWPWQWN